jgi:hypothetical protein
MFRFFGKAAPSRSIGPVLTSAPSEVVEGGTFASSAPKPLPIPVPDFANEKGGRLLRKLGLFVLRHPKSTILVVSLLILCPSSMDLSPSSFERTATGGSTKMPGRVFAGLAPQRSRAPLGGKGRPAQREFRGC